MQDQAGDDLISVVKIDGVVIDELTGEVLEYPDGWQGDLIEHLLRAGVHAKQQHRDWDHAHNVYRFAIGKMLESRNIERFSSDRAGRASVRHQTRRTATAERLAALAARHVVPASLVREILTSCASTFDVGRVEAVADKLSAGGNPHIARTLREELVETKVSRFVQIDPPRELAPNIVRLQRQTEGE